MLNRAGGVCRLPVSYREQSSSGDAAEIIQRNIGEWEVYRRGGNMKMPTDTLSQLVRLKERNDPSMDDPRALLFVADAFHYFLGAEPGCEHSLASYGRFFNREEGHLGQGDPACAGHPRPHLYENRGGRGIRLDM